MSLLSTIHKFLFDDGMFATQEDAQAKVDAMGATKLDLSATTSFTRSLLDDPNLAAFFATLGVSPYAQTLLDDPTSSAARTTLELGNVANKSEAQMVASGDIASALAQRIRFDAVQTLTAAQQEQARININVQRYGLIFDVTLNGASEVQRTLGPDVILDLQNRIMQYEWEGSGSASLSAQVGNSSGYLVGSSDYAYFYMGYSAAGAAQGAGSSTNNLIMVESGLAVGQLAMFNRASCRSGSASVGQVARYYDAYSFSSNMSPDRIRFGPHNGRLRLYGRVR